jgi:SAM-dependent methyltransferase
VTIRHDAQRIARLRLGLREAAFDATGVGRALGRELGSSARAAERPVLVRRAANADQRLRTAIELFVLELPVEPDDLERALAPATPEDLVELGVVREENGALRATVKLAAHDPFVLASDPSDRAGAPDVVMGVTRPATLLSHLTIRRPVRRALDIGTGNGILALLAARDAEHVVGTDINEHALELARFNASLNGVENVEFRLGSFLEPVEGEAFGLVVSNPPYVISPESAYLFRDSGLGGDRLSAEVLRLVPQALEEDGYASVTISWIAGGDEDVADRPRSWLAGTGCDSWLFHTTTDDPLTTAAIWNRDVEDEPELYAAQLDRWVDWYRAEGIDALAYGVCILHRREGANWIRTTKLPGASVRHASDQLLRLFAAQELLDDPALLERRLAPARDAVLRHALRPTDAGWEVGASELELDGGLGFTAALDGPSAAVVTALDGRPLGEALSTAHAAADVDAAEFEAAGLVLVRRLVELGFVVPAA